LPDDASRPRIYRLTIDRITLVAANPEPGRRARAGPTMGPGAPPADPDAETYYHVLGVPSTATRAEITRAYRVAMKRIHPDRQRTDHGAAEEAAKRLNRAYATLSKPLQRQAYDRTIRAQLVQDQLMNRYVGGFYVPEANGTDPLADQMRRQRTPAERRERTRADRDALVSIVVVFGGITIAFFVLLLLWAVARSLLGAAF
jgi:DnaJ-domain-containing protein 1